MGDFELLVDGLDFGEGPRWHDGRLWYSDFYQRAIYTVTEDGHREVAYGDLPDQSSGLGWLPDGRLLAVFMHDRAVMRDDGDGLVLHADLSHIATFHCNDMVVDQRGHAYVGNFGSNLWAKEPFVPADLALVHPDGRSEVAASGLVFPNGSVVTPDGRTLIVGESGGRDYVAFTIGEDGRLSDRRVWAELDGMAPDGCCLDEDGAIWFADAVGSQLVRVREGGEVTHRLPTPMGSFACMLGGHDGRTLYAVCAPTSHPDEAAGSGRGAIFATRVDAGRAGCP